MLASVSSVCLLFSTGEARTVSHAGHSGRGALERLIIRVVMPIWTLSRKRKFITFFRFAQLYELASCLVAKGGHVQRNIAYSYLNTGAASQIKIRSVRGLEIAHNKVSPKFASYA